VSNRRNLGVASKAAGALRRHKMMVDLLMVDALNGGVDGYVMGKAE
jgi:hypothetical protein